MADEVEERVDLCPKCPFRGPEFKKWANPAIYLPKLERDIPIEGHSEDRKKRVVSLPVYTMKVGDSFWHPWPASALIRYLTHLQTLRGWKFEHRMVGIGTRIWRVK